MGIFFANKYLRKSLEHICTIWLRINGLRDNRLQLSQLNTLSNRLITHSEQKYLKQSVHCLWNNFTIQVEYVYNFQKIIVNKKGT